MDISKYVPSKKVIEKISNYYRTNRKVNIKAIKENDKKLTYLYAACLIGWDDLSDDIYDEFYHKYLCEERNIAQEICKTANENRDYYIERTPIEKELNLFTNGLVSFDSDNFWHGYSWVPDKLLVELIDKNIPIKICKKKVNHYWDNNGCQWTEEQPIVLYPNTEKERKYVLVVHTHESCKPGSTKYTLIRMDDEMHRTYLTDVRVGVKKIIEAMNI